MSKQIRQKISVLLSVVLMIVSGLPLQSVQAETATNRVPITCYTISTENVNTYKSVNGAYSGYICANDKCTIIEVYDNGWLKVKYPVSWGTKTAYAKSSSFFCNTSFATKTTKIGKNMTVYRKSNLSSTIGTVYGTDSIIVIGYSENNTQILYPISGGYKLGWIKGKYVDKEDGEVDITSGYYQIKSAINTRYVIDVYGASTADCANIQLYHNLYSTNQAFIIKKASNGYYTIAAIHSNKLFDVYECQMQNGANIIQCRSNGGMNQYWKIFKTNDGYYSFKSVHNGLFIDVNGGIAKDEINIQCYQKNNTLAQKFVLQPVTVNGKRYNEGNDAEERKTKLLDVAKSQLGIKERSSDSDDIKYNDWYYGRQVNNNGDSGKYAWCAVFVSWCAEQAGIDTSVIPRHYNTTSMKNLLLDNGGMLQLKGNGYKPVKGDIIFFGSNASQHIGIVDYTSGNTVYYIDGNNTQTNPHGVHYSSCSLSKGSLYGFVTPKY